MFITVVTASQSKGIGNGLTYETDEDVLPGCLVNVPLRKRISEGIVIATDVEVERETYDVKKVTKVLSKEPVIAPAHINAIIELHSMYFCSIRQLLSVFLPPPPWHLMLPRQEVVYCLSKEGGTEPRGKRQRAVVNAVRADAWTPQRVILEETGASPATLASLVHKGILRQLVREEHIEKGTNTHHATIPLPPLTDELAIAHTQIQESRSARFVLFHASQDERYSLYAHIGIQNALKNKGTIVLCPDALAALKLHTTLQQAMGQLSCQLTGKSTDRERRDICRRARREPLVISGTRAALFTPLASLGTIIIDDEHSLSYKSEQSPRYHARTVAERICKHGSATLVVASRTPSLESWNAATSDEPTYELIDAARHTASLNTHAKTSIVDLADTHFGKAYPFSPLLFQLLDERLRKHEASVLFLNRRGGATALLCLECRSTINSPVSHLPMTVHTVKGTPCLIDHYSGQMKPVPVRCPLCQSVKLTQIGAGTERAEAILQKFFPSARITRADRDTLDSPESMVRILDGVERGATDILIGTLPVIRALSIPRVTLGAIVIADIGLSLPDFRAGERVFQSLCHFATAARHSPTIRDIVIQTFRPKAAEVVAAATGNVESYLVQESLLRTQVDYPPASRLIALIIRGAGAGHRAKSVAEHVKKNAAADTDVTYAPSVFSSAEWHVFIRGKHPESELTALDLSGIVIDVDPMNVM